MPLESKFQADLKVELKLMFPGCYILKNDARYIRGVPDLIILYKDKWAMLECKREPDAAKQPLQPYHRDRLDEMSFAAFIYPENKGEVLHALRTLFSS